MRLINTTTFELKEFGPYPPVYAILSHTWGEEEVTFQDMANLGSAHTKKGFAKIERCCRQALRDGLHWAWVDTCCIDKTSSAELSETINSMFKWYSRALKCYAFLEDVPAVPNDNIFQDERFLPSRWWTRGWTLQELIAPLDVEFYDRDWLFLARKNDCKQLISRDYGIPESILDHAKTLGSICAAERISWASARETSREEDMAYCLLGLMDVNMPLLYGEGGSKALLRLQEQVITTSEDLSLFLW
ncbi:HET-domain-containing protein, partial [Parathielavia hyrcaniae]